MIDFMMVCTRATKQGGVEIYPKFMMVRSKDLMIRGGDFYAVWVEDRKLWSTDEQDAIRLMDRELDAYAEDYRKRTGETARVLHLWDADSGMIDKWHKYCQRQMRDSFHTLDEKLIFANTETKKEDYASKKLSYPLEKGETKAYERLMSVLYAPEERQKLEWAIGAVVCGESRTLQKFMVLYGAAGTGKSTVLNIIQQLFEGYYAVFDAKALGSSSNAFALEAFRSNPLVAIQHDGDLSRIEDNTRINSLVSHELMTVNEKFKSAYQNRFKAFLFVGTNKPVRITDAKSGLIRRLIDVSPTGEKLGFDEYQRLMKLLPFELGAIAWHCQEVYLNDPDLYDSYIPSSMLGASNDFYNFMLDGYYVFKKEDGTSLKQAWEMYKSYCAEAKVPYPLSMRPFKEELRNYFRDYSERASLEDGSRVRSHYAGFRTEKFEQGKPERKEKKPLTLELEETDSPLDKLCASFPAQYATEAGTPMSYWDAVTTKLKDLDTRKLHYILLPEDHIVVDFDFPGEDGKKDTARNLAEAAKWPPTYAELSKGGGVHLHYIYTGDTRRLSRSAGEHIEIKVFGGKSAIRRKLTRCNGLEPALLSSGLPMKKEKNMLNMNTVKSERGLRAQIEKGLNREVWPNTKPSVDFICMVLDDAYQSGLHYDVTDMRNAVFAFAASSTNQADACLKQVNRLRFRSDEPSEPVDSDEEKLIFFDVEVFPNLFLVNWKREGEENPVVRMINPGPEEIEELLRFKLVGFNCRRYDNHILYGRLIGYDNEQLYLLSKKIVEGQKDCFFGEAYNLSYTDVYDFSSKKQSLKKFEIELGIHHQELGLPFDQPVPEELWTRVAEYCDNDVIATEAVFRARQADFVARQVLADMAGMTVNDTSNSLTTRIIFGGNRKPQDQFNYRNMGEVPEDAVGWVMGEGNLLYDFADEFTKFDRDGRPVFPGYRYAMGKSTYRGEEVGEGGYVYAEPGIYTDVALLDITSMHPSSAVAENLFGDEYTQRFREILDARIAIKHGDFDKARTMLGGALAKYLTDEKSAGELSQALKIPINSVYGLTSATFDNPFRDKRNVDNIVAKRGALFMINLKHQVQKKGFRAAHIKTDSIKIPNATQEIIQFVMDYGKAYGYNFEHEATYDRMCLVNDAVYIAKYKDGKHAGEWTATGTQFQVPYVFKKLFSKETIGFDDLCETKSVTGALYLDRNEGLPDGEHSYSFVGKVGRFCPIVPGAGGGILLREAENKKTGEKSYAAATGSKGYRWLEAEMVKALGKEQDIDRRYYDRLVDKAVDAIREYGDFDRFVSEAPYDIDWPPSEEMPF